MRIQNKLGNLIEHTVMITCRGEAEGTKKGSRRMSRRNSLSDVPQVSKAEQSLYKDVVDKHSGLDFPSFQSNESHTNLPTPAYDKNDEATTAKDELMRPLVPKATAPPPVRKFIPEGMW